MRSVAGRLAMVVVVGLAVVASVLGILIGLDAIRFGPFVARHEPPSLEWLGIASATVAIAQLARLRVRVGNASVQLAWGEAAIVVLLAMLPPVWIPIAVFVGVAVSRLVVGPFGHWRGWSTVANSTGAITLAGVAAALTAGAIAPTHKVDLSAAMVLALVAGAGVYTIVAAALVSLIIAPDSGNRPFRLFVETMNSKLLMIFGNVAIGLLIVLFCHIDWRFLVLLPPMFWLLHQSYAFRLRGDDDRRTWQAFAEATGALNRLDERGAVQAGIRGALRLFRAAEVEVVITGPDGRARRYSARSDQQQASERAADEPSTVPSAGTALGESGWGDPAWHESGWSEPYERAEVRGQRRRPPTGVAIRPLLVGGVRVGELRLRLPGSITLAPRDQLMFAAYGDALAAAVHDAATHDELLAMSERNTYDAVHDPLTGLVNRVALMSRGNMMLRRQSPGATVVLLLLDINRFKDVNNTLGHPVGDELLRVVASRLAATCGRGELLARLGGDEFALLVPVPVRGPEAGGADVDTVPIGAEHTIAIEYGVVRARQLSDALSAPTEVAGVSLSVEASIGVVAAAVGDVDMTELLRRADIAMYEAKRGGRSVAWYESIRDDASTDRLALLAELREALACREQLHVLLQPAISLTSGAATGVEALVRWQHPRRGLLVPEQFLPAVEQSELIGPFTLYVLELAIEVASRWREDGMDVPIAVNLSARSLSDQRLPADIERLLLRYGYPPASLVLEITESVVVSPLPVIDEVLAGLRRLGVQLAVDDFGTGYSSLTFLTRVAVDEVKVDKAFVARMVDFPEAAAIVRTTVDLARHLGLRVTAEGVETAEQRAALTALGCTAGQGYHFFPPVSPERVMRILQELRATNVRHLRAEGTG